MADPSPGAGRGVGGPSSGELSPPFVELSAEVRQYLLLLCFLIAAAYALELASARNSGGNDGIVLRFPLSRDTDSLLGDPFRWRGGPIFAVAIGQRSHSAAVAMGSCARIYQVSAPVSVNRPAALSSRDSFSRPQCVTRHFFFCLALTSETKPTLRSGDSWRPGLDGQCSLYCVSFHLLTRPSGKRGLGSCGQPVANKCSALMDCLDCVDVRFDRS